MTKVAPGALAACIKQHGFAAVLLLVALVMGSLYALLSTLNTATAGVAAQRDETDQAALKQAKDALIAQAALNTNRPGALPCPDTNNDGVAEPLVGGACPQYVGRLPWSTLGLPDLRDSAGERLWYALATPFTDSSNQTINSDTQGNLTVTGTASAANVIAIVFAPGPALGGQDRGPLNVNAVGSYLDAGNALSSTNFVSGRRCVQPAPECPLGPFNDRLITITHADLFNVVENMVAKRLNAEVAPMLRYLQSRWAPYSGGSGIFPFAAPFNPAQSTPQFCGVAGQGRGLLPVSQATSCLSWSNISLSQTGGSGSLDTTSSTCNPTPSGQPDALRMIALTCTLVYMKGAFGTPQISISATVQNALMSLAVPFEQSKVQFGDSGSSYTGGTPWLGITSQSINASAGLVLQYVGDLPSYLGPPVWRTITITFPVYAAQTRYQQDFGVDTSWFFANEWYRDAYYAVANGLLFGGSGFCTPPTDCFQVLAGAFPPINNGQVLLVLAGRSITGIARPTTNLAAYFEGQNDDTVPHYISFENRPRSAVFNDKVVVVAP